jgi:hypothetical protein
MKTILFAIGALFIVSNAYAADSWVLWEGTLTAGSGLPYEWKLIAAFPTYEKCIERHKQDFATLKKIWPRTTMLSEETIEIRINDTISGKGNDIITQKCLPETIDPKNE